MADYEARLAASPGSVREHRFIAQAYLSAHAYAKALEIAGAGHVLAPVSTNPFAAERGRLGGRRR